jgi:error-prone DNA polymerase
MFEPLAATNFSFLRGASHPAEMVAEAARLGLAGLAIADRNTLAGVVRAHVAAKDAGLRLVVGARLATRCGLEAAFYPHDRAAYGRLSQLLTHGNRRAPKGACDLGLEDLIAAAEGQVVLVCPPPALTADWEARAKALLGAVPQPVDRFIALARPMAGADRARAAALAALAGEAHAHLVATADALFHAPERRPLADVLACIREKTTVDAAGFVLAQNAERALLAPAEMARRFAAWPAALAAQEVLFDRARFSLDELRYEYPDEVACPGETADQTLGRLALDGAAQRYPHGVPEKVRAALDHELALIAQLDYARYFLTVHEIVRFARGRGILCQGRGSAANSVVCYCLGVTAVDPERVDLLFERFVSPERREPPDIDVDFEHERREEVIQYIYERFGRHRAGIAGTVISYRGRSAIREVAKALGLSRDVQDALARTLWGWSSGAPKDQHVREELGLDPDAPRLRLALDLAQTLQGFPRHLSQHVGGFVITRGPLDAVVPIGNAAMPDRTFVEWDKDDLDALGILKIDVLALGMLTCIARAFAFLKDHKGLDLGLADLPEDDPAVYDMICAADTVGVFQIESRAQMSMLPRLRPRSFYDLVIEVAIVRPGPIQGDMVHPYLRRRQGLEPVSFPSEALEQVLGKTLGVPLFQEQAMRIAIVAAGFTPVEADRLRRAMATFRKVGIIHEFGLRLVEGMVRNGYERDFAERCFRQIEGFGEYGFPESHAASFALLVYVSAWLKRHHPDVFLAAILNAQPMGFYAPAQLVRDARAHGVSVLPPDVNASDWDCTLEESDEALVSSPACGGSVSEADEGRAGWSRPPSGRIASTPPVTGGGWGVPPPPSLAGEGARSAGGGGQLLPVRLGLRQIKGFSEADAAKLVAARQAGGPFESVESLKRRARLSDRAMRLLADADAFGSLGRDRRAALWAGAGLGESALPLFAGAGEHGPEPDPHLPEMALSEQVAQDYARLRLSLKAHPIAFFRADLDARGECCTADLAATPDGAFVRLTGLVLVRQRPGTASGVIFMTLEDEAGVANVIVWPKVFARFRKEVLSGKVLTLCGRLQREGAVIHLIADVILDRTGALSRLAHGGPAMPAPLAHADEVMRGVREDPRRQPPRAAALLPASRDFH